MEVQLEEVFSMWSVPRSYLEDTWGELPVYKVKPDIENIRDLNLAVVKLTTVQMTRLPLQHKICKMGMICPAKPVLTEDLRVVQKEKKIL
jgi:hypothetical protein